MQDAANVLAVPNGYVGSCLALGNAALSNCSSRDGLDWTTPPDVSVFDISSGNASTAFEADSMAQNSVGYIAWASSRAAWSQQEGRFWYSADGIHWAVVRPPAQSPLGWQIVGLPDRFRAAPLMGATEWYETKDGTTWRPVEMAHDIRFIDGDTTRGFLGTDGSGGSWYSHDGQDWQRVTMPPGLESFFRWWVRMPNGHLLAAAGPGVLADPNASPTLVESVDGVSWMTTSYHGPVPYNLAVVGSATFMTVELSPGTGPTELLQSDDSGATWTVVGHASFDPDLVAGHDRLLLWAGATPVVGTPN
jgi:hypothetical protein